MPIGNPVTLTSNVASKTISATATASQTLFNVTGGYRINSLGVFKNGSRLQDGVDYIARDGLTVTLLSAASGGDKLQFVVFDTFRVAEAIRPAVDEQTIRGNLNVVGILSATNLEGPLSFNLNSGIQTFHDVRVGGALTVAGTLTYEDTTNTNTTGIATFSGGMNISGVGATITTLNVTGVSTFGDKVSIGDSIFHTGDINTSIRFPAADTFSVETGGSERFRVTSDGKVGINSASPHQALDIGGTTVSLVKFTPSNYGSGASDGAQIGVNFGGLDIWQFENNYLRLGTNNTERLRIASDGDVGIGTNNPSTAVHILSTNTGGDLTVERDGDGSAGPELVLRHTSTSPDDNDYIGQIIFSGRDDANNNTTVVRIDGVMTDVSNGSEDGELVFNTRNDGTFAERVRIDSAGRILRGVSSSYANASIDDLQIGDNTSSTQRGLTIGSTDECAIAFADAGDTRAGSITYNHGQDAMIIKTEGQNTRLTINRAGGVFTGIATATQLFEGTTRVATTGKAIAMAMLFG